MDKTLKVLGEIIEAYDSGKNEELGKLNRKFDKVLFKDYSLAVGAEGCFLDNMRQVITMATRPAYSHIISDSDVYTIRSNYDLMTDNI